MAKRGNHRGPIEPYLGDVVDMEPRFVVLRPQYHDHGWAKRGAVVLGGVLVVWWVLIWWVAG